MNVGDVPALDPRERISGGLAAALIGQILVASALTVVVLMMPDTRRALGPLLLFLYARIVGDSAKAFSGRTMLGMAIDGHAKALGWALLVGGTISTVMQAPPLTPPWALGVTLALAGVSLWGHHVQAERVSEPLAKEEGVLGAVLSAVGAPLAVTLLPLPSPWSLLIPILAFVFVAALSTRGIIRLLGRRGGQDRPPRAGWSAWYQEHFFRLTFLIAATIGYLFVRSSLVGEVPMLFVFEYGAAVLAVATVMWTLRNHLSKRLHEDPLQSAHGRHEQRLERQGETSFDRVEHAFGQFLDDGEPEAVQALVEELGAAGVDARTPLAPLTQYKRHDRLMLVHPGWLYAARLMTVLLVALSMRLFVSETVSDGFAAGIAFMAMIAIGLYLSQWNRYGGHWAAKTGLAYAGLALLMVTDATIRAGNSGPGPLGGLMGTTIGALIALVVVTLPLLHPWRASKGKPVPRYGYRGTQPLAAIDRLRLEAEAGLVRRALWIAGIGIVVFFVAGELSRLAPTLGILFPLYLLLGIMILLQPVSVSIGLRLGAAQVQRRHERERAERLLLYTRAAAALDQSFSRQPKRFGPSTWHDPTETG